MQEHDNNNAMVMAAKFKHYGPGRPMLIKSPVS